MTQYLGFDTSNYRTSLAYLDTSSGEHLITGELLPVALGEKGLRQSDALFAHTKALPVLSRRQFDTLGTREYRAVGVSSRPRSLPDSYMPCFLAGMSAAHVLGDAAGLPVHEFSHQQGHLASAAFGAKRLDLLQSSFLAWHLSGGTTELLLVEPDEHEIIRETLIGGTTDISAGQLIDRTGVMLGLGFPSGPELEKLADQSTLTKGFAVKVSERRFSLSGVENQVKSRIEAGENPADVARYAILTVLRAVLKATQQGLEMYPGLPVLCAGGVMSNRLIQQEMHRTLRACFAPAQYASDNALGVAILAAIREEGFEWTDRLF